MASRCIDDPIAFTTDLGGLHDVEIDKAVIDIEKRTLELSTEDIYANFAELPGHRIVRAQLVFCGIGALHLDMELTNGVIISEAKITARRPGSALEVALRAGYGSGSPNLTAIFESLHLVHDEGV